MKIRSVFVSADEFIANAEKEKRDAALRYKDAFLSDLAGRGIGETRVPRLADLFLVIGGDRTMLGAVHRYHIFGKPFFGINFGTIGFFMNDVRDDLPGIIADGNMGVFSFPFLGVEMERGSEVLRDLAINDFYVKPARSTGSCKLAVKVNNILLADRVLGDGYIASTAVGSTAYNLSAGGSAVRVGLDIISLVPINPHTPIQIKPIIVPGDTVVEIDVLEPHIRRVIAACDYHTYEDVTHIRITQASETFSLAFRVDEDFTTRLVERIMKVPV